MWHNAFDLPAHLRPLVTWFAAPVAPDSLALGMGWRSGAEVTAEKLVRPYDFTDTLAFIP